MSPFELQQRKQRDEVRQILAAVKAELAKTPRGGPMHSAGQPPVRLNEVIGRARQLIYDGGLS